MTGADVRALPRADLDALYASLRADRLPVGTFNGVTWPVPVWPVWRGKVFTVVDVVRPLGGLPRGGTVLPVQTGTVINRLGPVHLVRGLVVSGWGEVSIAYPFGLHDYLKPVSDTLWLGYLKLGSWRVWFTLERQ